MMPPRNTRTRMDEQSKYHFDPKRLKQSNRSKQLQTHNMPTDDVQNINSINKGRNLQPTNKLWIFHESRKDTANDTAA